MRHTTALGQVLLITLLVLLSTSLARVVSAGTNARTSKRPESDSIYASAYALAIDLLTPTTLYAGTDGGGVFKSTDSGGNWSPVNPVNVTQLATSPALPNVIMATLDNSITPIYSLNGGTCWESLRTTPFDKSPQIAIAPRSDGTPRFMAAVYEAGLYRTGDYGLTWAQQTFPNLPTCPPPSPTYVSFPQLIASPANPNRLYLRILDHCPDFFLWFENGIYISSDSGIGWVLGATTWVNESVYAVIPSPVLPERLYAKLNRGSGYYWKRSDDGGHTWTGTLIPVDNLVLESQDSRRLYGIDSSNGWRSVEGDEDWTLWAEQPCSAYKQLLAHPTISNTLLVRCERGLLRSFNGGDHWQQLSTSAGQFLAADYSRPGRILWARDGGLWASDDIGSTWISLVPSWSQLSPCPSIFLPAIMR